MTAIFYETSLGPVEIAPFEERDVPSILELFAAVFGVTKSEAEFRWQFLDNPVGVHYQVGREASGRVVSQFCSIPARYLLRGEEVVFGQIVDTIVHPDHRSGLRKKGLFVATRDAYVDRFGHPDQEIVIMGLPNPASYRIGRRLAGYIPLGRVYFHTKEIEPRPSVPQLPARFEVADRRFVATVVPRFADDLDQLWDRLKGRHPLIAVRDVRYMNWRYADCPIESRYQLLELRDEATQELVGVAVGRTGYLERPDGIIVDWLVERDDEIRRRFLEVIEGLMAAMSMTRVQILLNQCDEESRFFEERNYELAPTHYRMVTGTYDPSRITPDWLGRWWSYTLGDFDVV